MTIRAYGIRAMVGSTAGAIVVGGNVPPPSTDADAQAFIRGRGCCNGITLSWMIGLLHCPNDGAGNIAGFSQYFEHVLRFQGTYIQADGDRRSPAYGTTLDLLEQAGVDHNLSLIVGRITTNLRGCDLPHGQPWAGYISLRGHAIGMGRRGNAFYVMDPNLGLYRFNDADAAAREVTRIYVARGRAGPLKAEFYRC